MDGALLVWIAVTTCLLIAAVGGAYFSWEAYEKRREQRDQERKDFLDTIEEMKKDPP